MSDILNYTFDDVLTDLLNLSTCSASIYTFSAAKFENGLTLTGVNSATITLNNEWTPGTGDFTIGFWASGVEVAWGSILYLVGASNEERIQMNYSTGNGFGFEIFTNSGYHQSGNNKITSTPQFVSLVRKNGQFQLCVNGVVSITETGTAFVAKSIGSIKKIIIGGSNSGWTNGFPNTIDDLFITTTALYWGDYTPPTHAYLGFIKYLIRTQDGSIYKYTTEWLKVGTEPLSDTDRKTLFGTDGMDALPSPQILLQLSEIVEVLRFTNNTSSSIKKARTTAVPIDQLIHANGDIDLSGCSNIDWIHMNDGTTGYEAGNGMIRLLVSRDQGQTYYAHNGTEWVKVLDTTSAADGAFSGTRFIPSTAAMARVMEQGMTKTLFDAAPWQAWTIDAGYNKVRFAYGLSIAASTDTAFADNLKFQYDGPGEWKVAINGTDYEAKFSNTNLKLKWLTGGWRAKVNY